MLKRTLLLAVLLATTSLQADDGSSSPIHFKKIVLTNEFHSEGANVADINHDGKMDVVAGPFWYEGPDFTKRHLYWEGTGKPIDPHGYSENFLTFTDDFNGDGWPDVLIVGFPGTPAYWYENPGATVGDDKPWKRHLVIEHVDDESPQFEDLTGAGIKELVCIENQQFGYAKPDRAAPDKPWTFHPISPKNKEYQKFTHGIGVGDVNSDGRMDLIEKDGWWEQPASLAGDPVWVHHPFTFAVNGAQMYAVDLTGNHRPDIITSLNAHGYGLAWYEQKEDGTFEKHLIMGEKPEENAQGACFSQLHSVAIADMNGDGLPDIVTGKRHWAHGPEHDPDPNGAAVLYWFEAKKNPAAPGGIEFIAHQIDDDSGVGTQVIVADVNGDGKPDILVGNKKGVFVFIQTDEPATQPGK